MTDDWKDIVRARAGAGLNGHGAAPRFGTRPLDLNRIRRPRWAWQNMLQEGVLNSLVGVGGAGKSTLVGFVCAGITQGAIPGDLHGTPGDVLLVGDEDDMDTAWTPRIAAAGGDVTRVHELVYESGVPLDLARDRDQLRQAILETGAKLVYLDQVLDHLGVDLDSHRQKDVRQGLAPLRLLARELEVTALYAMHPSKAQSGSLRDRAGGSGQFTDVVRSGLYIGWHRDDPDRRVVVRAKANVGATPAYTFRLEQAWAQNPASKELVEVRVITDVQQEVLTIDDVKDHPTREPEPSKAEAAHHYLENRGADGEWRDYTDSVAECEQYGMTDRTFRDAWAQAQREGLIEIRKDPGDGRRRQWRISPKP